jgi:ABC-type antimicrobial peptide transport system permease subunit
VKHKTFPRTSFSLRGTSVVSLSLAQKNVTRKQERSFLTIVGVILAVGSFVALLSVAEGLHIRLTKEVYARNVDIYILPPSTVPLPTGPIGAIGYSSDVIYLMQQMKFVNSEKKTETRIEDVIKYLTPAEGSDSPIKKVIGITRFQENIHGKMIIIWGIPFEETALDEKNFLKSFFTNFEVADGVFPVPQTSPRDQYCQGEARKMSSLADDDCRIIMGTKLAQDLKMSVGSELPIKRGSQVVKLKVDCIGRFNAGFQDYFCFIPIQTALTIEDSPGKVKEIWIQVKDRRMLKETKKSLQSSFPDLTVQTSDEYLGASGELVKYAWLLQFAIALIGILIATTASMNTMLMSTFERIKEFGALRAIGASRFTIIMMILVESLILSITGGIFGIIIGLLGSRFLDGAVIALFQASFPIAHITFNLIIYAFGLSVFIGIIGALIPSIIIYKMDVITALRWE